MHQVRLAILFLLVLVATTTGCKKKDKDDKGNSGESAANISVMLNGTETATLKYQETLQSGGDSIDAFIALGKSLLEQQGVDHVTISNSGSYRVHFTSGMMMIVDVMPTDGAHHELRGGGNGRSDISTARTTGGSNEIGNRKVLVFSAFNQEFYNGYYPNMEDFSNGDIQLEATLVKDADADLSVVNRFSEYGFIILNTHGHPEGFAIKSRLPSLSVPHTPGSTTYTPELVRSMFTDANGLPIELFENGDLLMCMTITNDDNGNLVYTATTIIVTDNYIRKIPHLDKAVVYANYCYSGWTADGPNKKNMLEAMKSIGAISYYGYAYPDGTSDGVADRFAKSMEDTLINSLVAGDSTGMAHLRNNTDPQSIEVPIRVIPKEIQMTKDMTRGTMLLSVKKTNPEDLLHFYHWINPTYTYEEDGCGTFTDPRDGEKYKLACINGKRWFAENLRYDAGDNKIPQDDPSNLADYGRLYVWPAVADGAPSYPRDDNKLKGICPNGWHIPTRADVMSLFPNMQYDNENPEEQVVGNVNIIKYMSPNRWIGLDPNTPNLNETGFSIKPAGYVNSGNFILTDHSAAFWMSNSLQMDFILNPGNYSKSIDAFYIEEDNGTYQLSLYQFFSTTAGNYFSCRCVED